MEGEAGSVSLKALGSSGLRGWGVQGSLKNILTFTFINCTCRLLS